MARDPSMRAEKAAPGEKLGAWGRSLVNRLRTWAGKLPLPEDNAEPVDLSAPSVPYYTDLSRRFSMASLVMFLLAFIFVVVALISSRDTLTYANLYYLVKDINASGISAQARADRMEYPVSVSEPAFARYRGGLVAVGSEEVSVISGAGKQTLSVNVAYGTPAVAVSDKYFITYGRGECTWSIYNAFSQIRSEETEFPVYGAAVADDGSFAILTRSMTYTSEVIFYDKNMEKTAAYHRDGYVTCVAMNPAGTFAVIASVEDVDGHWVSKITLLRLSGRITEQSVTVNGAFAGVCGFTADDRAAVVFTDRVMVLRTDGTAVSDTKFGGLDVSLCAVSAGRIAVVLEQPRKAHEYTVTVLDKNGKTVFTKALSIKAQPTSASFGGSRLYLRASDRLFCLSADGTELTSAAVSRDAVICLPAEDDTVLVCGTAFAVRLGPDDFAPAL